MCQGLSQVLLRLSYLTFTGILGEKYICYSLFTDKKAGACRCELTYEEADNSSVNGSISRQLGFLKGS